MSSIIDRIKNSLKPNNKTVLNPNQLTYNIISAMSNAGEKVSVETALTIPAFHSCVQVVSESIGMLPFKLLHNYKGKTQVLYYKNEYKIMNGEVNDYMTADQFRQNMTASYLLFGDAVAEKEYALDGSVAKLHYIDPERVSNIYIDAKSNTIRYIIDGKDLGRDKIFHLPGLAYNQQGYRGKSILENSREILGLALAQMYFASSYFKNGATPSIAVLTKGEMTKDQADIFLKTWNSKYRGAKNTNKTGILPDGISDIKVIGSDAEKSQLLQSRQQTVIDICRMFRMPPHLIQSLEGATFSNIEEQAREFITYTLEPHIVRWEKACNQQLIKQEDKDFYYYKFNLDSLERGKLLDRYTAHNLAINGGWKNRNEIREIEDLDKAEGLDDFVRLGNLIENN